MTTINNQAAANDYKNLVDLLAVFSEATNRMTALQASVQSDYMELIDVAKSEYAKLQKTLGDAEAALEALTLAHPEWFSDDRKSIKTPYGTVKLTKSTSLKIPNEEATIILIEAAGRGEDFLRSKQEINREALEQLTDAELKPLRVKRITGQSFSVVAAKLDMGKAVKDADKAASKGQGKGVAA